MMRIIIIIIKIFEKGNYLDRGKNILNIYIYDTSIVT